MQTFFSAFYIKLQTYLSNFALLFVRLPGSVLPAHRAVLVARCDVMAAMFSGKYAEARSRVVPIHGVSSDTFLSFLEYLYTDSCCPGEFTARRSGIPLRMEINDWMDCFMAKKKVPLEETNHINIFIMRVI